MTDPNNNNNNNNNSGNNVLVAESNHSSVMGDEGVFTNNDHPLHPNNNHNSTMTPTATSATPTAAVAPENPFDDPNVVMVQSPQQQQQQHIPTAPTASTPTAPLNSSTTTTTTPGRDSFGSSSDDGYEDDANVYAADLEQPGDYYENEYPASNDPYYSGQPHEAFEDPYADTPFPDESPYYHDNNNNNNSVKNSHFSKSINGATTPQVFSHEVDLYNDIPHPSDPYGELDVSMNSLTRQEELEEIEMSRQDHSNLRGGDYDYELETKDPKTQGLPAFFQRYGRAIAAIMSGLCMSIVLVAIILAATLSESNHMAATPHHTGDHSLSPWGPRPDDVTLGTFVPPPLALEAKCTQQAILQSQAAFDECTQLCQPAQCCRFDPVAAPHLSCQRNHAQDCHTYHHFCDRPPAAAVVPFVAPTLELTQVCTAENIQTAQGVTACARACVGGTCCRFPTSLPNLSCLRGHEQECQMYHQYCEKPPPAASSSSTSSAAGSGQEVVEFPFVKPPDNIGYICSGEKVSTIDGFEACLEVCRSGTCCRFDPQREPTLSCRQDQPGDCPIYDQYCGGNAQVILEDTLPPAVDPQGGTGISGATTNNADSSGLSANNANTIPQTYLEQVCSDTSLATTSGFMDCHTACSKAECCWKEDSPPCNAGVHCSPFAHCLAMEASDHIDIAIQVSINLKCTDDKIATKDGRKDCLMACSQAACCFGNTSFDCPQEQDSFCNQYESCEKVMGPDSVPPAPTALESHCTADSLNTVEAFAQCEKSCSHAPCCWNTEDGIQPCATTNPLCEDYEACLILLQHSSPATTAPTVSIPTAPSFLKDVCTEAKIANVEGAILCQDACKPGECCWKTETCSSQSDCEAYRPCAILKEGSSQESAAAGSSGSDTSSGTLAPSAIVEPAPSYLDESCTTNFGYDQVHNHLCQTACEQAVCCWSSQSNDPCISNANCTGYDVCATVDFTGTVAPSQTETTTVPATTGTAAPSDNTQYTVEMIEDVCLNHDNSIVNLCAKVCAGSDCCFSADGQCGDDFPCTKYSACSILYPEDNTVEEACNTGDRSDCVAACGGSTCCFTTVIEKSCANTNPGIVCSRYKACEKLYGFNG